MQAGRYSVYVCVCMFVGATGVHAYTEECVLIV